MKEAKFLDYVITCYYDDKYLRRSLEHLKEQTFQDFYVTIVNDCSPNTKDEYQSVIQEFIAYMDIEYLKTKENSGPGVARQIALDNCKSKWVIFQDDDDYLISNNALENMVKEINENSIAVCGLSSFIGDGEDINNYDSNEVDNRQMMTGVIFNSDFLKDNNVEFYEPLSYAGEDIAFWRLFHMNMNLYNVHDREGAFLESEEPVMVHSMKAEGLTNEASELDNLRELVIRSYICSSYSSMLFENTDKSEFYELAASTGIYDELIKEVVRERPGKKFWNEVRDYMKRSIKSCHAAGIFSLNEKIIESGNFMYGYFSEDSAKRALNGEMNEIEMSYDKLISSWSGLNGRK